MEKNNSGNNLFIKEIPKANNILKLLDNITKDIRKIRENCRPALNGERYMTDKELSAMISVSRRTLHEWRSNEVIGYIQLGGKILYRESDVLKLMEKNFHKPYEPR